MILLVYTHIHTHMWARFDTSIFQSEFLRITCMKFAELLVNMQTPGPYPVLY